MFRRIVLIVLDSVGIGASLDANRYGDTSANTLAHIAEAVGGLRVPHMAAMGLGQIAPIEGVSVNEVLGCYGQMTEQSAGKDTTNGHWEMVGVILSTPLPTYPNGFPEDLITAIETNIGRQIIGNTVASGTEIIQRLGDEHIRTGSPIVYTSADSVFQIAAHEDVIPVEQLYQICEVVRGMLTGEHAVGRVIARPFIGQTEYRRTSNRKDFSLDFGRSVLDELKEASIRVVGIGKISDIYNGNGITRSVHTASNREGFDQTLEELDALSEGLIFTNLVDFDMLYGHRNDAVGFARAVESFDQWLPELLGRLCGTDLLIITADHGCDPTTEGTDHTREYVPLLTFSPSMRSSLHLGNRETFADLGATIAENFGIQSAIGTSFLAQLRTVCT